MSHSTTAMTASRAFELFYLEHADDIRETTKRTMRSQLNRWEEFADSPDIREITMQTFQDAKLTMKANGLANATINSICRAITTVLRHCGPPTEGCPHGRSIIPSVPYVGRKLRERNQPSWTPSIQQLSDWYDSVDVARWPKTHVAPGTFWRAFIVAAYNLGLRRSDLLSLQWDAVDLKEMTITVVCSKTCKIQSLPINATLARHLVMMAGTDSQVFPCRRGNVQFDHTMRRITKAAGIQQRLTPQAIRRRSGTSYEVAKPLAGQLLLGHAVKNVSFLSYINALEILRDATELIPQPASFLTEPAAFKVEKLEPMQTVEMPAKVNRKQWEFPNGRSRFIYRGVMFPLDGRALSLLRLLTRVKTPVHYTHIRQEVYADNPQITNNSIKGLVTFLRERLRVLFQLPDWYNAIPGRQRGWFLALPKIDPKQLRENILKD